MQDRETSQSYSVESFLKRFWPYIAATAAGGWVVFTYFDQRHAGEQEPVASVADTPLADTPVAEIPDPDMPVANTQVIPARNDSSSPVATEPSAGSPVQAPSDEAREAHAAVQSRQTGSSEEGARTPPETASQAAVSATGGSIAIGTVSGDNNEFKVENEED